MTTNSNDHDLRVEWDLDGWERSEETAARMDRMMEPLREVARRFPVSDLYVTVERHARSGTCDVQTSLVLPRRTISVGEQHVDPLAAFNRCIGALVRDVTALKQEMSSDEERHKHAQGTHHAVLPAEAPDAAEMQKAVDEGNYPAFRSALSVYEMAVRNRVGRRIQRHPELEATLGRGLDIRDVVEEAFLVAFDGFARRPQNVPLGTWLDECIEPALKAIERHPDEERSAISAVRTWREMS